MPPNTIMAMDVPTAIALLVAVGSLIWLVVRLSLRPLETGLADIKDELKSLITREEVERLIELRITQHLQRCIERSSRQKNAESGQAEVARPVIR